LEKKKTVVRTSNSREEPLAFFESLFCVETEPLVRRWTIGGMTADNSMAAVERMLKADAARGKKGRDAAPTQPGAGGGGGFSWKEPEEREILEPGADDVPPGGFQRPAPGSEEELAVMQAAWADENFRKAFYEQYGDKLEAAGIACDGTFPGMQQLSQIPGQDPNAPRGLTITPEPGFVIKTKTLETNEKVFINFCK